MRRTRTSRAIVLAGALTALFLMGQVVAVSPVQAGGSTAAVRVNETLDTNEAYSLGAPPGPFGKTAPANGATGQSTWPFLSWETSTGVTSFQYCYDTTNNGTCDGMWLNSGGASTVAAVGELAGDTTYWWQIRAQNAFGTTYADGGAWWSFTTGPLTMLQISFRSIDSQDGWILERDEDSTKGSNTLDPAATTARVGDNNADRQYRSILAFDTSALPDGAIVTGITLKIKRQRIVGSNPFTLYNPGHAKGLNLLKVDMQRGYYHDDPALERFDFHAIGSRGNVGRFVKTPSAGWWRAPLRAVSYAWLNLTGVTQFRLRFDLDDNDDMSADYLSFYTGDANPSDRPELIVDYYVP